MVGKIGMAKVSPLYLGMRANVLDISDYQRVCHKGLDADELTIRPGPANWAGSYSDVGLPLAVSAMCTIKVGTY